MTSKRLQYEAPPQLAVYAGYTTPNPGVEGVSIWSTTEQRRLTWKGGVWVAGDVYQQSIARRSMLGWRDTWQYAAQPAEFSVRKRSLKAQSGLATPQLDAMAHNVIGGSVVARAIPSAPATFLDGLSRIGYVTTASADQTTGVYDSDARVLPNIGSLTAQAGGFFFAARVALPVANAASRLFLGLQSETGATTPAGTVNPSVGGGAGFRAALAFGWDAADTALSFFSNGSLLGTPTKTALAGTGFAKSDTDKALDIAIYQPRGEQVVGFAYRRLDGSAQSWVSATLSIASFANVSLRPLCWLSSGSNATATALDISHVYLESEY